MRKITNAEWVIGNGIKFSDIYMYGVKSPAPRCLLYEGGKKLGEVNGPCDFFEALEKWLDMEHKEQILDEVERKYLENIVSPFKNKIKAIAKWPAKSNGNEYKYTIVIIYKGSGPAAFLPPFKADRMYLGMKLNHMYTLEELGL